MLMGPTSGVSYFGGEMGTSLTGGGEDGGIDTISTSGEGSRLFALLGGGVISFACIRSVALYETGSNINIGFGVPRGM